MTKSFLSLSVIATLLAVGVVTPSCAKDRKLPPWAFACAQEKDHLPAVDPEADRLYRYARSLEIDNPNRSFHPDERDEANRLARYYRIAAAHGHPEASLALIHLLWRISENMYDGVATPLRVEREKETERLIQSLIDRRVPAGFLRRGGFAAQAWDLKLAMSFYRQAADLGNPEAQFKAAELLDRDTTIGAAAHFVIADKKKLVMDLYQCSADQGYGDALYALGEKWLKQGKLEKAAAVFQQAIREGDAGGAAALMSFFEKPESRWSFKKRPWQPDAERVARYEKLRVFLIDKQYQRPKVPALDKIVPLPPAALPSWDGAIPWSGDTRESLAVEKPTDKRIARLATAKGLDPETGLPKP